MTPAHLTKLWTIVGSVLLFYCLNSWLVSQGTGPLWKLALLDNRPRFVSLFAIPICSMLLIVLSHIGLAYGRIAKGTQWQERMPVVFLENLNLKQTLAKFYQAFFLLVFLLIPVGGLVHFMQDIASANQIGDGNVATARFFDWVAPGELAHAFQLSDGISSGTPPEVGKVSYAPDFEPVIYCLLFLAGVGHAVWLIIRLFRPKKQAGSKDTIVAAAD